MKTGIKIGFLVTILIWVMWGCSDNDRGGQGTLNNSEVGVALYSFNRFAFPQTLDKSIQAGAQIVEGFYFHKLGGEYGEKRLIELSDQEVEELKNQIGEAQIDLKSMYAGGETLEEWEELFKRSKKLGAEFLVGEPGPELWDGLNELAGKYEMKLAIHEHARGKSIFWHPDSVLAAIEGHENFGACGDLGHWVRSGLDPVECLKMLEGHLISIHAKDLDTYGNLEANDVKVGSGVIDYEAVLEELKRQNFTGPIYIECEHDWENNLEDVKYAVEYIRRLSR